MQNISNKQILLITELFKQRHPRIFARLESILNEHKIGFELLQNAKDIWLRDFYPLCVQNQLFSYIYEPNYLKNYAHLKTCLKPLKRHLSLVLDGGNFVYFKQCALMCEKIFKENARLNPDEITLLLKSTLGLERLIMLPNPPFDRYAHSDGVAHFVSEKVVLINAFEDETYKIKLAQRFKNAGLKVLELELGKDFFTRHNFSAYINFIEFEKLIIMPFHRDESDILALSQLEKIYRKKVIGLNMPSIIKKGGALHCITALKPMS